MTMPRRGLAGLLATTMLLLAASPALAGEELPGPTLGGYLEEVFLGRLMDSRFTGLLQSHLRLKVGWPEVGGLSARGEFDLKATGTSPTATDETNIDRLYLRLVSGPTQATLGRQRIAWGNGTAFAPVDYYNPPNALDPEGPRRGADGLLIRRSLGALGYVAAAAAYVDDETSGASGLSSGLKAGTHVGTTDLSVGFGYDALAGRHITFAEAQGDLGVGWHATAARLTSPGGGAEKWAGAAGIDYSFGGKVVTRLEYAAGPAAGAVSEAPRWSGAVTYSPDELTSFSAAALAETTAGAPSTAILSATRTLGDAFDASLRLAWPFGVEGAAEQSPLAQGAVELKLRYSF